MPKSDEYDVPTSLTVSDIDFDGEKEIIIGTFGQELLVYKMVENMEEIKVRPADPELEVKDLIKDIDDQSSLDQPPDEIERKLGNCHRFFKKISQHSFLQRNEFQCESGSWIGRGASLHLCFVCAVMTSLVMDCKKLSSQLQGIYLTKGVVPENK